MKNPLPASSKRKNNIMSETEIDRLVAKLNKCFDNAEEYKAKLLAYIQQYCKAERGNAKRLAEITEFNKRYISNVIKEDLAVSLERFLEIVKKIREVEKNNKKELTKS